MRKNRRDCRKSFQLVKSFLLLLTLTSSAGCLDVRSFSGTWQGQILPEPAIVEGFGDQTKVTELRLEEVNFQGIDGVLTTDDGRFQQTPLSSIRKVSNDVLATLSFDGNPMRSYLIFAPLSNEPATAAPALLVVSLFADKHIELRAMRGNDLFGVFYLQR